MDDIEGFLGGKHRLKTAVPYDFLTGPDTSEQASVVITQLTDDGSLRGATLM